jgi:hypothetical protein
MDWFQSNSDRKLYISLVQTGFLDGHYERRTSLDEHYDRC